jgi:hypothetical protein
MKKIAICSDGTTRAGRKIISTLELLGATNRNKYAGDGLGRWYFINNHNDIDISQESECPKYYIGFESLEQYEQSLKGCNHLIFN